MKPPISDQKLRGGYYTPNPIAQFLATWAVRNAADRVLEPSCGDGVFLEAIATVLRGHGARPFQIARHLRAVELNAAEADKARTRLRRLGADSDWSDAVYTGDFFSHCSGPLGKLKFDAVLGNPPFIRYQNFPSEQRERAFALMRSVGLKPNGLTNAWVPFVCIGTTMLKDTGRLAMVVPAELLQVSYSAELRRFLSDNFAKVTLFTFKHLLFEGAEQEVVLVCADRNNSEGTGIDIVQLTNADELRHRPSRMPASRAYKSMDHSTEKWIQYFLSRREVFLLRALRRHKQLPKLGEIASVDVGVVTGLNEFFVLSEADRVQRNLITHTEPAVTRSAHLTGLIYANEQFRDQVQQGARSHMVMLPDTALERLPSSARAYVRQGERNGFNLGFKCRIRKRWWVVPSVWAPDGFLLRQVHRYPKLVVNRAAATCTDTIHRVKMRNGGSVNTLAAAFLNSLTFAFSEVLGRSYGGGVLELEPTEAESLPISLKNAEALDLDAFHRMIIDDRIAEVLDHTDGVMLRDGLGLSVSEVRCLRGIWLKLSQRRMGRKVVSARALRPKQLELTMR